jgi:glycine cleavage system aminomethyltransferase T
MEYERALYDMLMAEGEQYGMVDWGYRALDSMRLEKAYRLWGTDMSADWTPLQAGMDRFVNFEKGDFIGREALLRQKEAGLERSLACLVLEATDADARGFEPVFAAGKPIAYVASGGYGHTVQKSIAFSYLPVEFSEPGTELEVGILGERVRAQVVEQPLYDPKNERLLA